MDERVNVQGEYGFSAFSPVHITNARSTPEKRQIASHKECFSHVVDVLCLNDLAHCVNDLIRELTRRIVTPGHMRKLLSQTNTLPLVRKQAACAHRPFSRIAHRVAESQRRLGWARTRFPLDFWGSASVRARTRTIGRSESKQALHTQCPASTSHAGRRNISKRVLCYRATVLARALLNKIEVVFGSSAGPSLPDDFLLSKKNNAHCFSTLRYRGLVSLKNRSIPFLIRWKKTNTKIKDGQILKSVGLPPTETQPFSQPCSHGVEMCSLRLELEEYKKELKMSKEIISRQTQQLTQLSMQVADLKSVCETSATENELPLDKEEMRRLEQHIRRLRQKNAELEMQLADQAAHACQAFELRCALQEAQLLIRAREAELKACQPALMASKEETARESTVSPAAPQTVGAADSSVPSQSSSASSTFGDAVSRASVSEFDSEESQGRQPRCDQLLSKVSERALEARLQLEQEDLQKQLRKAQECCATAERRLAHREVLFRRWHRRKQREISDLHDLVEYERFQREPVTHQPHHRNVG